MSDLPFTLDQLRILHAISNEGSFRRAAEKLYISQPAVSLQIQNLEKQLNKPIFYRDKRKARLTETGKLLIKYCDRIILKTNKNLKKYGPNSINIKETLNYILHRKK